LRPTVADLYLLFEEYFKWTLKEKEFYYNYPCLFRNQLKLNTFGRRKNFFKEYDPSLNLFVYVAMK